MTDPVEQSRKWAEGLDASREKYDRTDFAIGRPTERIPMRPAVPPMTKDERFFRESFAMCYAGAGLYGDDGELQDCREHPPIDFLRDPPEVIEKKLSERAQAVVDRWSKVIAEGGHLVPDGIHLDSAEKDLLVRLLAAPTDDRLDAAVRAALLRKLGLDEAAEEARSTLFGNVPPRGVGDFKVICDESNNPPEEVAKNVWHADIVLNPPITLRAHWHCLFCKATVVKTKEVNWIPTAQTIIRPEDWLHPDGTPVLANDTVVCPECGKAQSVIDVNVMSQIKMHPENTDADEA